MNECEKEEIVYPFIVFESGGKLFCISSEYVSNIMQLPEYEHVPDTPPEISGIFAYRGSTVTMLDLRRALKLKTVEEEYGAFCDMLDARKRDHMHWVEELERTSRSGDPFTLATDPHKCALGKWYDNFHSDISEVNFHLHKIEEPHMRLHQAAIDVQNCMQNCEACKREECLKDVLERVRQEYMSKILTLLDETKDVFRSRVYHEMALVLRGDRKISLIVDKVLSVVDLSPADEASAAHVLKFTRFVSSVKKQEGLSELILELDISELLRSIDTSSASCRSEVDPKVG